MNPERQHMKAAYKLFQRFALEDQRSYWQRALKKYRTASSQVNTLVALFSFLTGFSAALAGLLVSAYLVPGSFANQGACDEQANIRSLTNLQNLGILTEDMMSAGDIAALSAEATDTVAASNCGVIEAVVNILTVLAVITPAIGSAFGTLASLYQWDRTVNIYEGALENLEVADAQSPVDDMDDLTYKAALRAYVENTLRVMAEETAQWGQAVRTPPELDQFVQEERLKAERASRPRVPGPLDPEADADQPPASG